MNAGVLTLVLVTFLVGIGRYSAHISWRLDRRIDEFTWGPQGSGMVVVKRWKWWASWLHGFSTEMAGAVVTALLFALILRGVEQQQGVDQRKTQLVVQMGSPNNEFAIEAARQLREFGWFGEGTLRGANLVNANLVSARLLGVNLKGANLLGAKFDEKTILPDAFPPEFDVFGDPTYPPDSYYKPGVTDMRKYTDPTHPDFWQPNRWK